MKTNLYDTRSPALPADLVCLSHLRWGFVYQRPQHLLSRFAKEQRVFYVEEPIPAEGVPWMEVRRCADSGVRIAVPHVPAGLGSASQRTVQKLLLDRLLREHQVRNFALWYYTPMALPFSRHLDARLTVFDCMDELSAFRGAPQEMKDREVELLRKADLVFTGGQSLYEMKKDRHEDVHCFPSSVDVGHFLQARSIRAEPEDQAFIPRPRLGYCGVIDERMDLPLLKSIAGLRPDWHFVMLGPVVKIDPETLPKLPNLHYLGGKGYNELPAYMAGWDVAMLPFAHNESTRFISPTKTPEYLASGCPVVSTSIRDVVRPYGTEKLVQIADTAEDFVRAAGISMEEAKDAAWLKPVDAMLSKMSWEDTFRKMKGLMLDRLAIRASPESRASAMGQAVLEATAQATGQATAQPAGALGD
ncbi:MAG: glycosyltransferase family 1 protein [Bryobacteraceae bacterium]